ncbi:MAG: hypothetical protein ACE5KJ_00110 [Candidatus Zixiibacteriota bacterium]
MLVHKYAVCGEKGRVKKRGGAFALPGPPANHFVAGARRSSIKSRFL